jgi:Kef-type K+ transport system membrane component KefB
VGRSWLLNRLSPRRSLVDESAQAFIALGALLLVGLLADEGSRRLGLPRITILLLLGFVAGPEVLDLLPSVTDDWFPIVSTIALTMVGFLLGGAFTLERLRDDGRSDLVATSVQGVATAVLVSAGLLLAGVDTAMALLLGGIAVATDPAATFAVVRERRAKGPFTRTLLAVVALDDVIALGLFGLLASVAFYLTEQNGTSALGEAAWEIFGAVLLGMALGLPAAALTGRVRPGLPTQEEAYGVVLLCAGLALALDVSFLLTSVVLGATVANRGKHHERPFREIERIEWPALTVFFVLAGASFDLSNLSAVGWLGIGYLLLRSAGKVLGGALGGKLAHMEPAQRWWLGAALLPQAGVAIGLSLLAADRFPDVADDLLAVVITATVLFELVGPILTRLALERVGESNPDR